MARKGTTDAASDGPVTIKKYANRRLYNTASSSYITLGDLAAMVRENVEFHVYDAKSGEDITHSILTQIIVDKEANGGQLLPVSFLRELIGMYGKSMEGLMPSYLEASMANFRKNQATITEAFERGMSAGPLAAIHETNMAMMRAATRPFLGSGAGAAAKPADQARGEQRPTEPSDELAAMREQMAQMQKRLDDLAK